MARRITRRHFLTSGLAAAGGAALVGTWDAVRPVVYAQGTKPIRIGAETILSGPYGGYGQFAEWGGRLAVEEINRAGGILGREVQIDFRDEEFKAATTVKNVRYHVQEWGADVVIGVDSSGDVLAAAEVMPQLDRILIVHHAATEKLNEVEVYQKKNRHVFRISVPVYQDGIASALVAKDFYNVKRWATVSPDYEYGYTSWRLFRETLSHFRPDVQYVAEAWAKFNTSDFSSHISKVMAAKPDGIFSTQWGGEAVAFVRQAKLFGVFNQIKVMMIGMGAAMGVLPVLVPVPRHPAQPAVRGALPGAVEALPELRVRDHVLLRVRRQGGHREIPQHPDGRPHRGPGGHDAGDAGRAARVPPGGPPGRLRGPVGADRPPRELPDAGDRAHPRLPGDGVLPLAPLHEAVRHVGRGARDTPLPGAGGPVGGHVPVAGLRRADPDLRRAARPELRPREPVHAGGVPRAHPGDVPPPALLERAPPGGRGRRRGGGRAGTRLHPARVPAPHRLPAPPHLRVCADLRRPREDRLGSHLPGPPHAPEPGRRRAGAGSALPRLQPLHHGGRRRGRAPPLGGAGPDAVGEARPRRQQRPGDGGGGRDQRAVGFRRGLRLRGGPGRAGRRPHSAGSDGVAGHGRGHHHHRLHRGGDRRAREPLGGLRGRPPHRAPPGLRDALRPGLRPRPGLHRDGPRAHLAS